MYKNSILNINNIKPVLVLISFFSIAFILHHYFNTIKQDIGLFNYIKKMYRIRFTSPGFWLILSIIVIMNILVTKIKYKNEKEYNDYKNLRSAITIGSVLLATKFISQVGSWTLEFFIAFLIHYFFNNLVEPKFNNEKASLK